MTTYIKEVNENGDVNINIPQTDLPRWGNYNIVAFYEGAPCLENSQDTGTLSIERLIVDTNISASLSNNTGYVGSLTSTILTVTVSSTNSTPSGVVTVNFNGISSSITVENGVATTTLDTSTLVAGVYPINITFAEQGNYGASSTSVNLTMNNKITPILTLTSDKTSCSVGDTVTLTLTAKDNEGNNIDGLNVTFNGGGG